MPRTGLCVALFCCLGLPALAQESSDPVAQALAQGDLYQSKRKYELALDAYHKADKLAHHTSAAAYLKIATIEKKAGAFPEALDDAKKSIKAAGDNKSFNVQALQFRAALLAQMAGRPKDKKLKEAEEELRQALALDPANALTHLDLGMILLRQERDAEGIPELNTYLASPTANPKTAAETREIIANPIRARAPFAPDFSFTTNQNQGVSNAALRGKVVLMDFWGTWCPPCRESVPTLRDLNKKYAGKAFQLVSVSSDDDEDVWKTFIKAERMDWMQYIDLSGDVLEAFKVDSFPTFVVLDKDGVIRFRQSGEGPATQMELEDAINKYLKRESDPKLAAAAAGEASHGAAPASSAAASGASTSAPVVSTGSASAADAGNTKGSGKAGEDSLEPGPGLEGGVVSGNTYKNAALGMTFQFPQGWVATTGPVLQAMNDRQEAAAKAAMLQQHPEAASGARAIVLMPKTVFYASRKGQWDGQHLEMPSIRVTAIPSRLDSVNVEAFQQMAEKMAAAAGLKLMSPASEFRVNKHEFARADFERTVGAFHVYQSYVQTVAGDYLVSIEIYAYSESELQQTAAALQKMLISDEDP